MTAAVREPQGRSRPSVDDEDLVGASVSAPAADGPATGAASRAGGRLDGWLLAGAGVAIWFAVVAIGRVWGLLLEAQGHRITLYTPPLLGGYRTGPPTALVLPIAVAASLVAALPWLVRRCRWRVVLTTSAAAALGWWVALALVDGTDGLTRGLVWDADFGDALPSIVADPRQFLAGFVEHLPTASIQIRAHPPGLPLLLAGMDRIGLGGPGWATALVLGSAAAGVVAVLITVRTVAGERAARRAAPFVALAPAATWLATSFDALYFGVAAWCVAALVLSMRATGGRRVGLAVVAGLLGAATLLLSYGLVLIACVVVFVAWRERGWPTVAMASITVAAVLAALVPFGFWYVAGLLATRDQYYGLGLDRPYSYFVVNNLSALALVVGPATAAALARLRDRRVWSLVGGALLAVALADASGLSNGEVERIWLPFAVWFLPAGVALAGTASSTRAWLAVQVSSAIVLSALISTFW